MEGVRAPAAARQEAGAPAEVAKTAGAIATRYDKLAVRYEAIVHIAAINERLRPDFLDSP